MAGDPTHPSGIIVEIVGIDRGDRGRSCEEHDVCGSVVEEDTLLRLRKEQIMVDGVEETAISCYWVTDRIDRCCVGFLKRHMVKHARRFDGALVQVTRVLSDDPRVCDAAERKKKYSNHGCALAAVGSCLSEEVEKGKAKGGKVQGGGGSAGERKAPERAISWRCVSCAYVNVDVARVDCRMCRAPRTEKKMETGKVQKRKVGDEEVQGKAREGEGGGKKRAVQTKRGSSLSSSSSSEAYPEYDEWVWTVKPTGRNPDDSEGYES